VRVADLAATLGSPNEGAQLRTGTVVSLIGASTVTVDIGGGQLLDMPALTGYAPIAGDVVQILQQGPVQLVLGRTNPMSGANALANPSFELNTGAAPQAWTKVIDAGTPTGDAAVIADIATAWGPVDGSNWLAVSQSTAATVTIHMASRPVPVTAGQVWTAAGYAANASIGTGGGTCALRLTWYNTDTAVYPTTVAADAVIASIGFPQGGVPGWTLLRQWAGAGYAAPTGATWLRVVLSTTLTGGVGSAAYWDGITCRRIGA
jgi:hypothetical protein